MKVSLQNISSKDFNWLLDKIRKSRNTNTYLSISRLKMPLNLWILVPAIIFFLMVLTLDSWSLFYLSLLFGTVFISLTAIEFQKLIRWSRIGKNSVSFDQSTFVYINGSKIEVHSLHSFKDADIILGTERRYIGRFHFQGSSIIIPCRSKNDERILEFQNSLKSISKISNDSDEKGLPLIVLNESFLSKLSSVCIPIIIAAVGFVLLFFTVPKLIDRNQYLYAIEKGSASSFREYLAESRNLWHREEARMEIMKIYNLSIEKYKNKTQILPGSKAFVQLLEYLRDNNLFTVQMQFTPQSELNDINRMQQYKVIPITPSFSNEKNKERQKQVIATVKTSFEKMFPTDIMTIGMEENAIVPRMEIIYTYRNNPESLYYPVKEENTPLNQRTWYYGIEINWEFEIFIPSNQNSIYEFNLVSRPAHQFNSESFAAEDVYSQMALTAFNDFKKEFYNKFINWDNP